ncbi:MAG: TIGR02391 family protein [archaeon]|nr:TIGR02391 family protein [archaeon]
MAWKKLEQIRDLLRFLTDMVKYFGMIEQVHHISLIDISKILPEEDITEFMSGLIERMTDEQKVLFMSVVVELSKLRGIENPMLLPTNEKIIFAEKLDSITKKLEKIAGVGRIITMPTDLDQKLTERCIGKDYHDTLSNAFPLLEDRIRNKASLDKSFCGDKLIDAAFNPERGKLVLGDTEAEKKGVYFLFKGAILYLRNPPAHSLTVDEGKSEALKIMYFVDLLLKIIEKAKIAT